MTNEEKARGLSQKFAACFNDCCSEEVYNASIEIAEWKDKQIEALLPQLMICAQQGYVQCAKEELVLKEMKKIVKENGNY